MSFASIYLLEFSIQSVIVLYLLCKLQLDIFFDPSETFFYEKMISVFLSFNLSVTTSRSIICFEDQEPF